MTQTNLTRELLLDWLDAAAGLAGEFYAVCSSDYDDLNAKGRERAAMLGIDWDEQCELISRNEWHDSPAAAAWIADQKVNTTATQGDT